MIKKFFLVFFSLMTFSLFCQEVITSLVSDACLLNSNQHKSLSKASLNLPFFDDFSNNSSTVNFFLWEQSSVRVNRCYAINPPSLGVATFDGLNENGLARDFSSINSSDPSDTLLSKKINLNGINTAFFMFYFQGKGLGESPENQDRLVLEFLQDTIWVQKWFSDGQSMQEFEKVVVLIDSSHYLVNDFQFRFRNYATVSGNFDHWHIDYLKIDELLSASDTSSLNDVSFVYNSPSFLKRYSQMPWNHFLNNESIELKDSINIFLRNNNASINVDFQYNVFENDNQIFHYPLIGVSRNVSVLDYDSIGNYSFSNPPIDIQSNVFNSFQLDSASFLIQYIIGTSNSDKKINDTLIHEQNFYSNFAYDDGTAESAYGININGAKLAYEFKLNRPDTLRAIQMYFPQMLDSVSNIPFKLTIWDDISGQGNVIYQQNVFPVHTPDGSYHTYYLDSLFQLVGTFYIGWEQTTNELLNIGLDMNNVANSYMFYNIGSGWEMSSYLGSWMIRPVLSMDDILSDVTINNITYKIYPNPAKHHLFIKTTLNNNIISVYSSQGNFTKRIEVNSGLSNIDISEFSSGIYFIEILNSNGISYQKIIIQ